MSDIKIVTTNKKAYHEYTILEEYNAGIVLTGTEIKSIRASHVNLADSFASVDDGEVWIYNMYINPYEQGNIYNHEPKRKRKLLLTKKEILKITNKLKESGLTLIPLKIYLQGGWAKVTFGLAKGKKLHDKRETIAKKSAKRDIERAIKENH